MTIPRRGAMPTLVGIGAELRNIRRALGWSLADVEAKSGGAWKAVVVGSYERGDRAPRVESIRGLLNLYGGHRLEIVSPDDIVHCADQPYDPIVRWLVVLDRRDRGMKVFDVDTRAEAESVAAMIPGSRVGYRLVGPITYVEGS